MDQSPTADQIQQLRDQLLKKIADEGSSVPGGVHPADLSRVKSSDDWLRRFLLHHDLDAKEALNMAWDTLKWRKTFGTNDLTEKTVRIDYLEDGSMFSQSHDKDGKSLFILKCKKHFKGQRDLEELKRCIVYWFERLERQDRGDQITIFFDMAETGLSNMDMEFTKYLINLCKLHYPHFLNYIVIFEMPWVLNAAFKIIKTWLPEKAVQKIRFVNKNTLKDIVEPDQALACWGGKNDYEFSFVPEDRSANGKVERKVHFADKDANDTSSINDSNTANGASMLKVNPSDHIIFNMQDSDISGSLEITNTDEKEILSYKVKTTSPERYRVRPSTGTLKPGASLTITVHLSGNSSSRVLQKDKFLLMSAPVDSADKSTQELNDFWKQTVNQNVESHHIKCIFKGLAEPATRNGGPALITEPTDPATAQLTRNISRLTDATTQMQSELKSVRRLQSAMMALLLVLGVALAYVAHVLQSNSTSFCLTGSG